MRENNRYRDFEAAVPPLFAGQHNLSHRALIAPTSAHLLSYSISCYLSIDD